MKKGKIVSLLLVLIMILSLFAGCASTPIAKETKESVQESVQGAPKSLTVSAFESWLNEAFLEVGCPMTVAFLEPDESGVVHGEFTYTGDGKDIYTPYLYAYVIVSADNPTLVYTAGLSARENSSPEVLKFHQQLSEKLGPFLDPEITGEMVDALFVVPCEPKQDSAYVDYDADTGIEIYFDGTDFSASYTTAGYTHSLQTEIATGHVWYLFYPVYNPIDDMTEATLPLAVDIQNMINDAFKSLGYPYELTLMCYEDESIFNSNLKYIGDDTNSIDPNTLLSFYLYVDPEDPAFLHEFNVTAQDLNSEESLKLQRDLMPFIQSYFIEDVAMEDIDLLFDTEPNYDTEYYYEGNPNFRTWTDGEVFNFIYEDAFPRSFHMLTNPVANFRQFTLQFFREEPEQEGSTTQPESEAPPIDPSKSNFYIANGLMEDTGVIDNHFPFIVNGDPITTYYFYHNGVVHLLNNYLEPNYLPYRVVSVESSVESAEDIGTTNTSNRLTYRYNVCLSDEEGAVGPELPIKFIGQHHVLIEPDSVDFFQITYPLDVESAMMTEEISLWMAKNMWIGFEHIIQLPVAISMLCDNGMTISEAEELFSGVYEPYYDEESGMSFTVYAPRDVVHVLAYYPDSETVTYTVKTKYDYEKSSIMTSEGDILYTIGEPLKSEN